MLSVILATETYRKISNHILPKPCNLFLPKRQCRLTDSPFSPFSLLLTFPSSFTNNTLPGELVTLIAPLWVKELLCATVKNMEIIPALRAD